MIDLNAETLLSLPDAAKRIPWGPDQKCPGRGTVWRWIKQGCRGVKLEAQRVGGRWITSVEALQRFTDELTAAESEEVEPLTLPARRMPRTEVDPGLQERIDSWRQENTRGSDRR